MAQQHQEFYATLLSNASMKTYSDNTIATFKTLLPERKDLEGDWQVGLVEVAYPVSWHNVEHGQWFQVCAYSGPAGRQVDVGEGKIYISEGRYQTPKDLIDQMKLVWGQHWWLVRKQLQDKKNPTLGPNEQKTVVPAGTVMNHIERVTSVREDEEQVPSMTNLSFRVEFNEKTNKVKFFVDSKAYYMKFSKKLKQILDVGDRNDAELSYSSESEVDVNRARHTMFVYCDLVEDSIVGDVRAPLLRTTLASGKYGEDVREVFNKPMYIPLRTNHFDTIQIAIKTETGEDMPFNYGISYVILHFRRVGKYIL